MLDITTEGRPGQLAFQNGDKAPGIFSAAEYERRLAGLRAIMGRIGLDAVVLTSMHGVHYHSGFLYCSFGRPYALVGDQTNATTVSAMIDGGQPWLRSHGDNLVYTDWKRNNYWRAVNTVSSCTNQSGRT